MNRELILGDDSYLPPSLMDGTFGRGLVPRDMAAYPAGSFAPPAEMSLIPRSEWSGRIREMEANRSRLSDLRFHPDGSIKIPSTNQATWGYCWAYSTVSAALILREKANQPYLPLSAFGVAYTIKGGRDEGGWGALSLDFIKKRGIPTETDWPNLQPRRIPGPEDPFWDRAKPYRITDAWVEINDPVYDRDLTFDQVMTCLLNRVPVVADFFWWTHAICLLDPVEVAPGQFGVRCWNSWTDRWENNGMAVLTGSRAVPNNAVAPYSVALS